MGKCANPVRIIPQWWSWYYMQWWSCKKGTLSGPSSMIKRQRKFPKEQSLAKRSFAHPPNFPKSKIGTYMVFLSPDLFLVYHSRPCSLRKEARHLIYPNLPSMINGQLIICLEKKNKCKERKTTPMPFQCTE